MPWQIYINPNDEMRVQIPPPAYRAGVVQRLAREKTICLPLVVRTIGPWIPVAKEPALHAELPL